MLAVGVCQVTETLRFILMLLFSQQISNPSPPTFLNYCLNRCPDQSPWLAFSIRIFWFILMELLFSHIPRLFLLAFTAQGWDQHVHPMRWIDYKMSPTFHPSLYLCLLPCDFAALSLKRGYLFYFLWTLCIALHNWMWWKWWCASYFSRPEDKLPLSS